MRRDWNLERIGYDERGGRSGLVGLGVYGGGSIGSSRAHKDLGVPCLLSAKQPDMNRQQQQQQQRQQQQQQQETMGYYVERIGS